MNSAARYAPKRRRLFSSRLALAIALATGTAVGVTALEAPAHAQKKKKKKASKQDYSDAFKGVYPAMAEQVNADAPDLAALKAGVPALVAASTTTDDKFAAGNLIFTLGRKANDQSIQLTGMNMMLESGKVPAEQLASYSFAGGQLAFQANDFAMARTRFEQAAAAGYTEADAQAMVAEAYYEEGNHAAGVDYITGVINQRLSAGETVDDKLIQRALAMAFNNDLMPRALKVSEIFVSNYPSETSWDLAITTALSHTRYSQDEILDLMRLARRTDAMKKEYYGEYIETADPRKLPGEVAAIISEGLAAGAIDGTDPFITESRATANRQIAADKADLPALERDATKPTANLRTVIAAANVLLSYGEHAKAEPLFAKAKAMPGADLAAVTMRLGITQLEQGKYDAAKATFAQVKGNREPIARLWSALAEVQNGPKTASEVVADAALSAT